MLHHTKLNCGMISILQTANTPEEAKELVQYLSSLDWNEVFNDRERSRQRDIQRAFDEGGGYCSNCNSLVWHLTEIEFDKSLRGSFCLACIKKHQDHFIKDFNEHHEACDKCHTPTKIKLLIKRHPVIKITDRGLCSDCIKILEDKLRITCTICGVETIDHTSLDACNDCYIKYPNDALIMHHKSRAKALGMQATLTVDQWLYTVKYFEHKCAYCPKPYEVLEHYLPLSKGGGTTANNCIPACRRCNSRKGDHDPSKFDDMFPKKYLTRIREYLGI